MSTQPNPPALADLLSVALDGTPNLESQQALNALLSTDPAVRLQYVNLMLLDTMLAEEFSKAAVTDTVDLLANDDLRLLGANPNASIELIERFSRTRKWTGYAVAAVLVLATAFGLSALGTREVSAATLLAQSRRIHDEALDQCYVVEVSGWPGQDNQDRTFGLGRSLIANLLVNRVDRLWTRGDRFFIESSNSNHRWVWGQDESGAAWLALNRRVGLQVEPDEMPEWLATICDLLTMRVDTLLDEVSRNFELNWETSSDPSIRIVRATPKPSRKTRWLREAVLEIDVQSKILKRVIVKRTNAVDRLATVTYTLATSQAQPDESYSLIGHLESPFTIFSRANKPDRRDEILMRLYMNRSKTTEN